MPVLVQIDAWDPLAGTAVALRAASHDDPRVCMLGGETWWPVLTKSPALRYDFFDGAFGTAISTPSSTLALEMTPWPAFGRYAIADARIRLWHGELGADWSGYTLRFDGRVTGQPVTSDLSAEVKFGVDDSWLDAPLLATYAGTGGLEGGEDLTGQPKPLALGAPRYAAGTLIDTVNSVVQLSAYGGIRAVEAALERLARFNAPLADYATYAALIAATIPAGAWATCLAQGLVRFGAPPQGQLSFLLQGDTVGGWSRLPGSIIRRIAQTAGGGARLADATLVALDAARPWPLSLMVTQQTPARALIQSIAASVNAVAGVSWTGQLFVLPVGIGAQTIELRADGTGLPPVASLEQAEVGAPWWRLGMGAERCWTVHALGDIATAAALTPRGDYDGATVYREGDVVTTSEGSRWEYIANVASSGHAPPNAAYWAVFDPSSERALAAIDEASSDGVLSRIEKKQAIIEWQAVVDEAGFTTAGPLQARALQLGLDASLLTNARTALAVYLGSIQPAWNNTDFDSAIVAATYRGRWSDYYAARRALLLAISRADANATPGANDLRNSAFPQGLSGFVPGSPRSGAGFDMIRDTDGQRFGGFTGSIAIDTLVPAYAGKRHVAQIHIEGMPPFLNGNLNADLYADVLASRCPWPTVFETAGAESAPWMMPVKQGDRVFARGLGAEHRCSLQLYALIFDAGLNLVEPVSWGSDRSAIGPGQPTFITPARAGGGQGGDPANMNDMGGWYDVTNPAAARMAVMWRLRGTGAADPYVFVTEPGMGKLTVGQTRLPPYVDGPGDPAADKTGDNTSKDTSAVNGVDAAQLTKLISDTSTTANAVSSFTKDVADNNKASPDEKKRYAGAVSGWDADVASEVAAATAAGITTEASAYQTAYAAFRTFLVDTVRINDLSTRTYFDRGQFQALSSAFTAAAAALQNAVRARVRLIGSSGRAATSTFNSTNVLAGIKTLNLTGFALSQAKSGSTVTVHATQSQYRVDTGTVLTYPAADFPGLAFNTQYYFFRDDPNLDGGGTYGVSSNLNDASSPSRIYLGYIVTMSEGGTGGGGGGGGTEFCVVPTMWLDVEGIGPVLARDVVQGQRILCLTEDLAGTEFVDVQDNVAYDNILCRIEAATGEVWEGAINTPVPLQSGGYVIAGNAKHSPVPVGGPDAVAWSDAIVEWTGVGPVQRISCHERIYAAGRDPRRYVFTHNAVYKP